MKKLFVAMIALLLLIGGTVSAQQQGQRRTPEERAKMQADAVKTALNLTDDQTTKVVNILLEVSKKTDSLRKANQGGDFQAMRGMMKPLTDARDAKIKAILTAEQAATFEAKKNELFRFGRPQAPAQQ